MLKRLQNAGVTINKGKCQFCLPKMEILGYVLEDGKIKPSDQKLTAISQIRPPKSKKQVRALLGLIQYYRKMVPSFAEITYCLTELLKKDKPDKVQWELIHQQALDKVKKHLMAKPVLGPVDPNKDFMLQTDSSMHAIGSVLAQIDDNNKEYVVAYASRKLLPREMNYSTVERECLSILWSLEHWDQYIYGRHVTVYSDHKALQWLNTMANNNSRLQRWSLKMERYDVTTLYKPGSQQGNCDALSRLDITE